MYWGVWPVVGKKVTRPDHMPPPITWIANHRTYSSLIKTAFSTFRERIQNDYIIKVFENDLCEHEKYFFTLAFLRGSFFYWYIDIGNIDLSVLSSCFVGIIFLPQKLATLTTRRTFPSYIDIDGLSVLFNSSWL